MNVHSFYMRMFIHLYVEIQCYGFNQNSLELKNCARSDISAEIISFNSLEKITYSIDFLHDWSRYVGRSENTNRSSSCYC